ncbi:surfeit locus protein 1-like [Corticium candelabrum]|uniref:surfeit locus protein 1-like n=1 Tax=Corticium candelabrum TaxID=121492 RepID=UPI002E26BD80|nr:surfeit locus protein 1-like [Corticium candelabrum]XP_062515732.1 surfeit locus protein 1-like [Corticium candelabrum]
MWLLIIPVTTASLGTWQIFRLRDKLELKLKLEAKTQALPIEMPSEVSNLDELEYRRVVLHGFFDHGIEFYIRPRQLLSGETRQRIQTSEPGAQVITPFYCRQTNSRILVNRGWVPKSRLNPQSRLEGQIEGEVTLTALIRRNENRPIFMPKNDIENNMWHYKDLEQMSSIAATEPILVDADATTTIPGGPIGGQTVVSLRNDHLQYIFTWYCLSLFTFYMWFKLRNRQVRSRARLQSVTGRT